MAQVKKSKLTGPEGVGFGASRGSSFSQPRLKTGNVKVKPSKEFDAAIIGRMQEAAYFQNQQRELLLLAADEIDRLRQELESK